MFSYLKASAFCSSASFYVGDGVLVRDNFIYMKIAVVSRQIIGPHSHRATWIGITMNWPVGTRVHINSIFNFKIPSPFFGFLDTTTFVSVQVQVDFVDRDCAAMASAANFRCNYVGHVGHFSFTFLC